MPKAENWRELLADLQELALEGGFAIEELARGDVILARRGMDKAVDLTDVAQELAKRGWKK